MLGLVFKTSVRHFVSQVGSTPTSFRQIICFGLKRLQAASSGACAIRG